MNLENILTKVDEKLANDEIGLAIQKCDSEAGELAIMCLKSKIANAESFKNNFSEKIEKVKETILGSLSKAKQTINSTPGAPSIISGVGGATLGGLFGNLSSSKGEYETEEDFKNRKRNSTITGSLAGGAVGASLPSILNSLNSSAQIIKNDNNDKIISKIKGLAINDTTIPAAGGALAGRAINSGMAIANKSLLSEEDVSRSTPALLKAIGDHTYFSDKDWFKKLNNSMQKRVSGGLGAPVVRKDRMAMTLLKNILKRKNLLPIAGMIAAPTALNQMFGNQPFNQPAFE